LYQDCIDPDQLSDVNSDQDDEENRSNLDSSIAPSNASIITGGTKISSSSKDAIITHEVQEHLILPEYPDTDEDGILHIIHASENPLQDIESTSAGVNEVCSQLMSSVCFMYL
jgi:hypothetical protein